MMLRVAVPGADQTLTMDEKTIDENGSRSTPRLLRKPRVLQRSAERGRLRHQLPRRGRKSMGPGRDRTCSLLVVLGGPIGVYETAAYPFLEDELRLVSERLIEKRPTLGICLGAQLIAAALGAEVDTGLKEIGFAPVTLTDSGRDSPLRHLEDVPVLHWHRDVAGVPRDCDLLARTDACANQAFSRGPNVLAVQFHPEVDAPKEIERWLIGHAVELAQSGVDVDQLRRQAHQHGRALHHAGQAMLREWLSDLRYD